MDDYKNIVKKTGEW